MQTTYYAHCYAHCYVYTIHSSRPTNNLLQFVDKSTFSTTNLALVVAFEYKSSDPILDTMQSQLDTAFR